MKRNARIVNQRYRFQEMVVSFSGDNRGSNSAGQYPGRTGDLPAHYRLRPSARRGATKATNLNTRRLRRNRQQGSPSVSLSRRRTADGRWPGSALMTNLNKSIWMIVSLTLSRTSHPVPAHPTEFLDDHCQKAPGEKRSFIINIVL